MKQKIFYAILALLFSVVMLEVFGTFMINHTYYFSMLSNPQNRRILISLVFTTAIPIALLRRKRDSRKHKLKNFFWSFIIALALFTILHTHIKQPLLGTDALIMLTLNTGILLALATLFFVGTAARGGRLRTKLFGKITDRKSALLSFGLGFVARMTLIHLIIVARIFHPALTRALLGGRIFFIRHQRKSSLATRRRVIEGIFSDFLSTKKSQNLIRKILGLGLLGLTLGYLFLGFNLSFIPYPTARDANHLYLYRPKIRAENFGALGRSHPGWAGWQLRLGFISFWMSLLQPLKNGLRLAPDTAGVSLNFRSGLIALVSSLGLTKVVIDRLIPTLKSKIFSRHEIEEGAMFAGRFGILLRLLSGMGAFLLFVDNKTDIGVLSLTVFGLIAGFSRLQHEISPKTLEKSEDEKKSKTSLTTPALAITSGLFFAAAVTAKPTAFLDVALFVVFFFAVRASLRLALGLGAGVLGAIAKLQFLYTREFLSPETGTRFLIFALIFIAIGIFDRFFLQKKSTLSAPKFFKKDRKHFGLRAISLVGLLLLIKLPYILQNPPALRDLPKTLLMAQTTEFSQPQNLEKTFEKKSKNSSDRVLLAQNDAETSSEFTRRDATFSEPTLSCSRDFLPIPEDQLFEGLRDFAGGDGLNDDVGRYVGFGQREFLDPATRDPSKRNTYGPIRLAYPVLRTIFPRDDHCYTLDSDIRRTCQNQSQIFNGDLTTISETLSEIDANSPLHERLAALQSEFLADTDPIEKSVRTAEAARLLRIYLQGRVIETSENSIRIPYRYLVPRNAVFNRSLQNLSSYYTDIGFIRRAVQILLIITLITALIARDRKLIAFSGTAVFGRIFWRVMAGGIVRYGIGLIIRSLVAIIAGGKHRAAHTDKKNKFFFLVVIALLAIRALIQTGLNLIRIASQGPSGPFARYKTTVGQSVQIDENLQQTQSKKFPYRADDILKLQFPLYLPFIDHVADRPDEHGVAIDGTYLQYFLANQKNLGGINLRKLGSDGNLCLLYHRLVAEKTKYIVTDPNILSIIMGEGNSNIRNRFLAKTTPDQTRILDDGELTLIVKMRQAGYLDLFYSNNLATKYAFLVPDAMLDQAFGTTTDDARIILRAKMTAARFFPEITQQVMNFTANVFTSRLANSQALDDLADLFGRVVDTNQLRQVLNQLQSDPETARSAIAALDQDARFILTQFLALQQQLQSDQQQYQQSLIGLMQQSMGSSQVMIFERIDE